MIVRYSPSKRNLMVVIDYKLSVYISNLTLKKKQVVLI